MTSSVTSSTAAAASAAMAAALPTSNPKDRITLLSMQPGQCKFPALITAREKLIQTWNTQRPLLEQLYTLLESSPDYKAGGDALMRTVDTLDPSKDKVKPKEVNPGEEVPYSWASRRNIERLQSGWEHLLGKETMPTDQSVAAGCIQDMDDLRRTLEARTNDLQMFFSNKQFAAVLLGLINNRFHKHEPKFQAPVPIERIRDIFEGTPKKGPPQVLRNVHTLLFQDPNRYSLEDMTTDVCKFPELFEARDDLFATWQLELQPLWARVFKLLDSTPEFQELGQQHRTTMETLDKVTKEQTSITKFSWAPRMNVTKMREAWASGLRSFTVPTTRRKADLNRDYLIELKEKLSDRKAVLDDFFSKPEFAEVLKKLISDKFNKGKAGYQPQLSPEVWNDIFAKEQKDKVSAVVRQVHDYIFEDSNSPLFNLFKNWSTAINRLVEGLALAALPHTGIPRMPQAAGGGGQAASSTDETLNTFARDALRHKMMREANAGIVPGSLAHTNANLPQVSRLAQGHVDLTEARKLEIQRLCEMTQSRNPGNHFDVMAKLKSDDERAHYAFIQFNKALPNAEGIIAPQHAQRQISFADVRSGLLTTQTFAQSFHAHRNTLTALRMPTREVNLAEEALNASYPSASHAKQNFPGQGKMRLEYLDFSLNTTMSARHIVDLVLASKDTLNALSLAELTQLDAADLTRIIHHCKGLKALCINSLPNIPNGELTRFFHLLNDRKIQVISMGSPWFEGEVGAYRGS